MPLAIVLGMSFDIIKGALAAGSAVVKGSLVNACLGQ